MADSDAVDVATLEDLLQQAKDLGLHDHSWTFLDKLPETQDKVEYLNHATETKRLKAAATRTATENERLKAASVVATYGVGSSSVITTTQHSIVKI